MALSDRLLTWFGGFAAPPAGVLETSSTGYQAKAGGSSKLPDPGEPKAKAKATSVPTLFDRAKPDTSSAMRDIERNTTNTDLTTFRNTGSTKENVAIFARVNPDLSAAIDAYLRVALTKTKQIAYDRLTGQLSVEATNYVQLWLSQHDYIGNYAEGYAPNAPTSSILESLAWELRTFGSCSLELALNAARQADRLQPVGVKSLRWYPDKSGKWSLPKQVVGGEEISLDIPTFFYTSLDQSLYSAYSESPLEPALQPVLFALQFLNDVRRVIRNSVHPRTTVELSQEELYKLMPPEAQSDTEEAIAFYQKFIESVQETVNGLEPEEALVYLDTMKVDILDRGSSSLDAEYKTIMAMADSKVAAGAKTLPAVLGKGGNQTTASVESMLFIKAVAGAVQEPLSRLMSRVATLIARLAGYDVYVEFEFEDINLRPELELEGFRAQKQARILELWSLGVLSDEQASLELVGKLPTSIKTPLAGTMFYKADASNKDQNNYSGTSVGGDGGGGAQNQALKPKTSPNKSGDN